MEILLRHIIIMALKLKKLWGKLTHSIWKYWTQSANTLHIVQVCFQILYLKLQLPSNTTERVQQEFGIIRISKFH